MTLPIDEQGWSVVPVYSVPATNYVEAAGDDDHHQPFKTVEAALQGGSARSVMLKRGETFTGRIRLERSGESPDRPFVFGSYGDISLPRPILDASGINIVGSNIAVVGVELRNGGGIDVADGVSGITLEDYGIFGARKHGVSIGARNEGVQNVSVRRGRVVGSGGQGLYVRGVDGFLVEENLIYNSGPKGADGLAKFSARWHNIYARGNNHVYRHNLIGRGANMGMKFRAPMDNLTVDGNFLWGNFNGVGLTIDGEDIANHPEWGFTDGSIVNNVLTGNGREGGGYGIEAGYTHGMSVWENLIAGNSFIRSAMQFKHKHALATTLRQAMIISRNIVSHNDSSVPIRMEHGRLIGPDNTLEANILQAGADEGRQVFRGFKDMAHPIDIDGNSVWTPKKWNAWVQSNKVNHPLAWMQQQGWGDIGTAERVRFKWEDEQQVMPTFPPGYVQERLLKQRRGNWNPILTAKAIGAQYRAAWTVTGRTPVTGEPTPDQPDVPRANFFKISQMQIDDIRGLLGEAHDYLSRVESK